MRNNLEMSVKSSNYCNMFLSKKLKLNLFNSIKFETKLVNIIMGNGYYYGYKKMNRPHIHLLVGPY